MDLPKTPTPFINDVIYEILSFSDDFKFLILNCSLVSKQWFDVILTRNLSCLCHDQFEISGQFLQNIASLKVLKGNNFKVISQLKRLTKLDISKLFISETVKYIRAVDQLQDDYSDVESYFIDELTLCIGELKHLTYLDISSIETAKGYIDEKLTLCIGGLEQLTYLDISQNLVSDEETKHIIGLKHLKSLNISYSSISNGAKHIGELRQLTFLNVSSNNIGSECAKYIGELEHLTHLEMNNTRIDEYFGQLKQLTHLNVYFTNISDTGIKHLYGLMNLTNIITNSAYISDKQSLS